MSDFIYAFKAPGRSRVYHLTRLLRGQTKAVCGLNIRSHRITSNQNIVDGWGLRECKTCREQLKREVNDAN